MNTLYNQNNQKNFKFVKIYYFVIFNIEGLQKNRRLFSAKGILVQIFYEFGILFNCNNL